MNHSLRAVDVKGRTSEWQKRPKLRSRSAPTGMSRCSEGSFSTRIDRTSPIELLADRYPVIRRLVGQLSFRVVACRFILSDPPGASIPNSFGNNFPRFIRSLGNAACIEYVADVAELEMLRWKAQYAPYVQPLAALALSSQPVERLKGLRVTLHPSVCLVQSRFPIVTVWENNQTSADSGMIERWVAEAALVSRSLLEVEVRRLPSDGYSFLHALSEGNTVATAVTIAAETTCNFDVVSNLKLIEEAKVAVDIQQTARVPRSTEGEWV